MTKKNEYDSLINYFESRYYLLPHYFCNKEYLDQEYLPKLKRLQSMVGKKDIGIVAGAYEKIGDMFDCVIGSEKKAIEYFKISISLDPDFYYSYGEIAWKYYCIGKYKDALKNYNIALKKTNDSEIRSDLLYYKKMVQASIKKIEKPITDCNDDYYLAKEELLFGNPDAALKLLKNKKNNDCRILALCCFLEKQDFETFYIQLKKLIDSKPLVSFMYCFLFYLPQQIKNDLRFWSLLNCRKGKTSFIYEDLHTYLKKKYRANYKKSISADNSNTYRLYYQYKIAQLSLNKRLINQLAAAHPKWQQIQTLLKKIKLNRSL